MKTFFRRYYTHNRWVSATKEPLDALQLDSAEEALPVGLSTLYLDLRPFMNRRVLWTGDHWCCSTESALTVRHRTLRLGLPPCTDGHVGLLG